MDKSVTRKGLESLLRIAVALCLLYSGVRAVEFIVSHIPPYKEGTCLQPLKKGLENLKAKIEKNYVIKGYSYIGVIYEGYRIDVIKATFDDERESAYKFVKTNCN
jgi:hypothetical protein